MSSPRRQRIVIDLNRSQMGDRSIRPRPWLRVLALLTAGLFLILIVGCAGIYLWWRHYQTTPAYSLAVIVDAAQRSDMATFDRLVDSDKIIDGFSSRMADNASPHLGLGTGAAIQSVVALSLPAGLRQNIHEILAEEIKQLFPQGPKPFIVLALTVPAFVKISSEGATAMVDASVSNQWIKLTMQQTGSEWKVVRVDDDALVTRLISEFVSDVPTTGQSDAIEPRKRLKKHP